MSQQKDRKAKILVASAWTGGHIFPGIAICEELKRYKEDVDIFFVTNKKAPTLNILDKYGYKIIFFDTKPIKGKGKLKNLLALFPAFFSALNIVKKISPSIILGLGGALSGPICISGKIMNIPVVIHEQNLLPGFTNRILSHFADKVFVSFSETKNLLRSKNIILSGNPVRKEFFYIKKQKNDSFTLLVMGGSQGSLAINHAFLDALYLLNKEGKKIDVIHQTGRVDYKWVINRYRKLGLKAYVKEFIEDMPSVFRKADLVISRAGASTIFELSASGTPSILIPYPYAADQHQEKNAIILAKAGGAEIILQKELSGKRLAQSIAKYIDDPEKLKIMGENARFLARPESAHIIAKHIKEMLER